MWDKTAADIQTDVALSGTAVSGTSKYVADWSSKGFDPAEGTNFLALHFKATLGEETEGVTCVVEAVPSQGSPSPAFNDDDCVVQLTENSTGIKVTVSKEGKEPLVETFDISDLTLETE